jgi:hypothetical protein
MINNKDSDRSKAGIYILEEGKKPIPLEEQKKD